MQLRRLLPRLVALHQNAGLLLNASRPGVRVCVDAPNKPIALSEQQQDEPRVPGSRRTLFQDTAPLASGDAAHTGKRELLVIHAQSLEDAGVGLSQVDVRTNRLASLQQSMRRETLGAGSVAVSPEYDTAVRRSYTTQRRGPRDDDAGGGDGGAPGSRGGGSGGEGTNWGWDRSRQTRRGGVGGPAAPRREGSEREENRGGRGDSGRPQQGRRQQDRFQQDRFQQDRFQQDRGQQDRGQQDRFQQDKFQQDKFQQDKFQQDKFQQDKFQQDKFQQDKFQQDKFQQDKFQQDRFQQDKFQRDRFQEDRRQRPGLRPGESLAVKDSVNLRRAAAAAAAAVAGHAARRRAAQAAYNENNDDDDDEMEEGEGGEEFSLQQAIGGLRASHRDGSGAAAPAAATARASGLGVPAVKKARGEGGTQARKPSNLPRPITSNVPQGPRLSHNLPADLNMRLLEAVLAGSKAHFIPEIPLGMSGISQGLITSILLAWRTSELVKLRIRDRRKTAKKYLPYMREVCNAFENMTGGVVVWRSGRSIWMYRGVHHQPISHQQASLQLLGKTEVPLNGVPLLSAKSPLRGTDIRIPGADVGYLTRGSANPPAGAASVGVIFLHDALGSVEKQQHSKHVCDRLSALLDPGATVLMPALTGGGREPYGGARWPPLKAVLERQKGWLSKEGKGNFAAVADRVDAAVSYLRGPEVRATKLVLVGTGWGGWLALHFLAADAKAAAEPAEPAAAPSGPQGVAPGHLARGVALESSTAAPPGAVNSVSGLTFCAGVVASANHFFEDEQKIASNLSVPVGFVCGKHDPMEKFQLHLMPPLVDFCSFKRFGKLNPGFWGSKADWSDPEQVEQATQALVLASSFLRWHACGDGAAGQLIRSHSMMGKCGAGVKQTANTNFPWLTQVALHRSRKQEKRDEKAWQRQQQGRPRQPAKPKAAKGRPSWGRS